jgi:signal transduction histidine kinase
VLYAAGQMIRQAEAGRDRTQTLMGELEAARDDQAAAAVAAERAAIARDLHDVLAHSLSGLAIQLEGARRLARNEAASPALREVIDRSAALAKEGLVEARRAVGVLRDEPPAMLEHLPALVEHYRDDLALPVELVEAGERRPVTDAVGQTLYRVAGEALTNVVRHAPGAVTEVTLTWAGDELRLRVANEPGAPVPDHPGAGFGLLGIAERVARIGGRCHTGPVGERWVVDVTVPA